jgi:hypothetical protein
MSIFNWGIYGGYGIAFPVGRYVPTLNAWDLVSRRLFAGITVLLYHPFVLSIPLYSPTSAPCFCFISETDTSDRPADYPARLEEARFQSR